MNKLRTLLMAAALAVLSLLVSTPTKLSADAAQSAAKPNVLFIAIDDLRTSLGEQDRWCKGTNFERDTRVPLMIHSRA